jgi:hypothetical protein
MIMEAEPILTTSTSTMIMEAEPTATSNKKPLKLVCRMKNYDLLQSWGSKM